MSSPSSSGFASVKLPAPLVDEARSAAQTFRRSVAGQIEYWAALGRAFEQAGITSLEARQRLQSAPPSNPALAQLKNQLLTSAAQGTLQSAVQDVVRSNRAKRKSTTAKAA